MRQRKGNSVGDRLLMILVGLFLYAPIIILIVFSFNAGNSSSVWKGFSLHWYAELLNDRLIMHSVYTTLLVSLLALSASASVVAWGSRGSQVSLVQQKLKQYGCLLYTSPSPRD